ncbi:MAG: DUF4430 domain-containing protein [Clostridia bacterium]|nr:DUF4430 domain-containing protein [Clostridia bacterium]
MKKKTVANIIMVSAVVLTVIAGIFFAAHTKGRFDPVKEDTAYLTDRRGIVTLERDGVAFIVSDETTLRAGDLVTCEGGGTVGIALGDDRVHLGRGAEVRVVSPDISSPELEVLRGEAFADTRSALTLSFGGRRAVLSDCVASLSVRAGAESLSVFCGSTEFAASGEIAEWTGGALSTRKCPIESLNDFTIARLREAGAARDVCFSPDELDALEASRAAEKLEVGTKDVVLSLDEDETAAPPDEIRSAETTGASEENGTSEQTEEYDVTPVVTPDYRETERGGADRSDETSAPDKTPKEGGKTDDRRAAEDAQTTDTDADIPDEAPKETKLLCTVTIRCDTILSNFDMLPAEKAEFVPDSGCILPAVTLEIAEGESAFDVLRRACEGVGVRLEYSYTPLYESYYVEGIGGIYEFDCGPESGWMYKIDGWFPNYGASEYRLSGGESIVWCYTCTGLGADVGDGGW